MTAVQLSGDSVVTLYRLHIGDEVEGAVEVGRPETGVFVSLPKEGATLVRWLQDELPLDEVSTRFCDAYGVDTDVGDFVRELSGCGFVESIVGHALPVAGTARRFAAQPREIVAVLIASPGEPSLARAVDAVLGWALGILGWRHAAVYGGRSCRPAA